jgi:putative sterol carrier protein
MQAARGSAERPDAVLEAAPQTLVEVVYGGRKFADALRAGDLIVEGDKSVAKRFVSLFPLPSPASA